MPWLHAFVDVPSEEYAEAATFWSDALGWPAGDPWRKNPEFRSFEPPTGTAYVHIQRIGGPSRVHLDVESEHRR